MRSADASDCEDTDRPVDAVCASHPERRASIECPHCGSYACGDCTVDTLWGDVMCDACQRHGRARYPLPWEQSLSPAAFLHTAYLVFADTVSMFGALPAGKLRRALGFAASVAVLTALSSGLTQWLFVPRHWAARAPSLSQALIQSTLLELFTSLAFGLLVTGVFHGAAVALGGRSRFVETLRAVCYLNAVALLDGAGSIADTIVGGGTFAILFGIVALFFVGWALSVVGEQRYALPRTRAALAGSAPVALLLLLAAGLYALSLWLAPRLAAFAE